jgi:hypothetical protein
VVTEHPASVGMPKRFPLPRTWGALWGILQDAGNHNSRFAGTDTEAGRNRFVDLQKLESFLMSKFYSNPPMDHRIEDPNVLAAARELMTNLNMLQEPMWQKMWNGIAALSSSMANKTRALFHDGKQKAAEDRR